MKNEAKKYVKKTLKENALTEEQVEYITKRKDFIDVRDLFFVGFCENGKEDSELRIIPLAISKDKTKFVDLNTDKSYNIKFEDDNAFDYNELKRDYNLFLTAKFFEHGKTLGGLNMAEQAKKLEIKKSLLKKDATFLKKMSNRLDIDMIKEHIDSGKILKSEARILAIAKEQRVNKKASDLKDKHPFSK